MKILYIVYFDGGGRGGHVAHARGVIDALAKNGAELSILAPGWRGHAPDGVRIRDVWQWRRSGATTLTFALAALPKLVWELWRNRPTCIYARYFNLLFLFALIARLFRVPVFTEHNADMQAEHKMYRRGALGRAFHDFAERTLLANCAGSVVVTASMLESWRQRYGSMDSRVIVIRNGVNASIYAPRDRLACRRELGLEETGPYVGYVGSFGAVQGLRFLLGAFASVIGFYPSAKLVLAGASAGELENCRAQVATLGLSASIMVIGQVAEDVAAKYIGAADVCVAPYARSVALCEGESGPGAPMKGDPLKIYAYMACARPVVASYFREAGQHLQEIGAGISVTPEDVDELGEAIVRLLGDEPLRASLSNRGRAYVERFATWDMVGQKTLQFMAARLDATAPQP